jgi:two-component system cell cycle response regulator DivK
MPPRIQAPMPTTDSSSNSKPLVLLVDDDRECREMYAQCLRVAGFDVAEAHNGNQALSKAAEQTPSVVVTDLALPGIDGYQMTRKLRQQSTTERVPIIALTGYGGFMEDTQRALAAGCDAVLTKPCLPDRLLEEIERLLTGRHRSEDRRSHSA